MIRYRVRLPDDVKVRVTHFSPSLKRKIRAAFDFLEVDPRAGKPLERELSGLRSIRVMQFRVVYQIQASHREIHVVGFGHRKEIYDLLSERLRQST